MRDAREATTAIGANAKTLLFASTTNTDHAPEGLSGSLRRTAMTLREDTHLRGTGGNGLFYCFAAN